MNISDYTAPITLLTFKRQHMILRISSRIVHYVMRRAYSHMLLRTCIKWSGQRLNSLCHHQMQRSRFYFFVSFFHRSIIVLNTFQVH